MTLFSYYSARSPVHDLDVRAKLLVLPALSVGLLAADPAGAGVLALCVGALYRVAKVPLLYTLREARLFLLLALFVFLSRSVAAGHAAADQGGIELTPWLVVLPAGALDGADFVLRFLALFLAAHLFVRSSSRSAIVRGIHWWLSWLPRVPAADIALMGGLSLSFVSVLTAEASEVRSALALRCAAATRSRRDRLRQRVLTMKLLGRELMRRTLIRSGEIAQAIVARGYRGSAGRPSFPARRKHWAVAIAAVAISLGTALL